MSSPAAAAGGVDPAYEFDCPRYRDFREADDEQADNWFGQCTTQTQTTALEQSKIACEHACMSLE